MKRSACVFAAFWVLLSLAAAVARADAKEWERLKGLYDYDRDIDLRAVVTEREGTNLARVWHVEYTGANGERVPALFAVPKDGKPPFPCVLLQHGYSGSKDDFLSGMIDLAAMQQYAVLAIDAQYHGERKAPGYDILSTDIESDREALIQTVIDLRRGIDFLETRDDVDTRRIGYVGFSMGAILGTLTAAVEPRIDTCVLVVGGGDWPLLAAESRLPEAAEIRKSKVLETEEGRALMEDVEPLNFAPHIAPRPTLMLNGTKDTIVPKACADKLYEALKEPKKIVWYKQGHNLTDSRIPFEVNKWLAETLKADFDPGRPET
jgi:cephalosporin-C deacetylase-like acetyl esterase